MKLVDEELDKLFEGLSREAQIEMDNQHTPKAQIDILDELQDIYGYVKLVLKSGEVIYGLADCIVWDEDENGWDTIKQIMFHQFGRKSARFFTVDEIVSYEEYERLKSVLKDKINIYSKSCANFEVAQYSDSEKKKIIEYMLNSEPYVITGLVTDCITGEQFRESNTKYTDREFSWSTQDIYHIKNYNAAITEDFYKKVLNNSI